MRKTMLAVLMVFLLCGTASAMDTWAGPGFYTGGGSTDVSYFTTNPSGHNGSTFLGATLGGGGGTITNTNTATGGAANATATTGPITNTNNVTANGGAGGSATVTNRNDLKNTNIQGQDQKQKQQQGQIQGQGQNQSNTVTVAPSNTQSQANTITVSPTNGQTQSINNGQTISPNQQNSISQNTEATKIPAGLGRDFAAPQDLPFTQFVQPNKPDMGFMMFDPKALPPVLTYGQAEKLAGKGKAEVMAIEDKPSYRTEVLKLVQQGDFIGYVTGTSKKSIVEAWGAAYICAMEQGATRVIIVKVGMESRPSAFFIGLGSSYTHSQLSGSEKDASNTAGGSGLIGYSTASQNQVVGVVLMMFRAKVLVDKR